MQVSQLWRYPFKSAQGAPAASLELASGGVVGDRHWALIDAGGRLCSAKRYSKLLLATGRDDGALALDDGTVLTDDSEFSEWLHTAVHRAEIDADAQVEYEMTFEPPNDDAEYYAIPAPPGRFVDLADVHIVASSTLAHLASARPDLDWDVRRFRPNIVVETDPESEPFVEASWVGREIAVGEARVRVDQETVRCAMPLRAQPGGLERQAEMFHAMDAAHANHVGVYCTVVQPGIVPIGGRVTFD
ncbi:MAG TPA: MOSC N-terminal beta barrel domain-containing protein [Acidimicrobiia bacterium]